MIGIENRRIILQVILKKGGFVLLGGTIQGLGMGLFLFPHSIPSGGAGGIAVLLNYLFNMSMGPALWFVNFSMLIIGVKVLGKRFGLWTFIGITMTSVSIHFFETTIYIDDRNIFYDLVFGSMFLGLGIGLLMRKGVSNGGIGVIAFIIALRRKIPPGKPLFLINCFIFLITAAVINWSIIIFAFLSQWMATSVVDFVYQFHVDKSYTLSWRKKP